MNGRSLYRSLLIVAGLAALVVTVMVPAGATTNAGPLVTDVFQRRGPEEVSPSGQSVFTDCQAPNAVEPEGWPDATATLRLAQVGDQSAVTISVRNARPATYFTVWLRLGGTDSNGDPFGGNPLTDGTATPLARSSDLPTLLASTGAGNGNDAQPNGFSTDDRGNATYRTVVDFPIVNGAYPFHRFPGWDATDDRLPAADPAIYPVAVAGPQGPYTLRIVSHCTDGIGHGLTSGPREWWFDWTIPS
jgi:hypothetical protein